MADERRSKFIRELFVSKYRTGSEYFFFRGATWNAFLHELGSVLQEGRITSFANGEFKTQAGGTSLGVDKPGAGAVAAPAPFAVTIINQGGGSYQAWINLNSTLFLDPFYPDRHQTITGLGLSAAFNLDGNDLIWLELSFSNVSGLALTGATIKSYGMGDVWNISPASPPAVGAHSYYEFTTSTDVSGNTIQNQTVARIRIAQTIADSGGAPVLNQLLSQNLIYQPYVSSTGYAIGWAEPTNLGLYIDPP
jgi:hypothetical protein